LDNLKTSPGSSFGEPGAKPPKGGFRVYAMKTIVYVDGFNLYYGAVKGTSHRWLNLARMCQLLLPHDTIHRINYYTALVNPRPNDPDQRVRQEQYLRALRTIPNLSITLGFFLAHEVTMPLSGPKGGYAKVIKTEEKGSDVNIATHLVVDGFRGAYEMAVVVSNDSDLALPIRIVVEERGRPVGLLNLQKHHPSVELAKYATFIKHIRSGVLARSQFPPVLTDANGSFSKPQTW
jgi:hypothetical protein